MLARTKLLTFTLSFVIIFSLSVTFLSANGYFVNRQLRKYSDDLKDEVERREAELEMLKAEEGGGMGENFLSLGREEVVAVNRASSAAPIEDKGRDESQSVFYLPFSALFLLSVFASLAITFILDWLKKDKRNAKRNNR